MMLSVPKPTRDILPAANPAIRATIASTLFHAIVKYSSLRPRRAVAARSITIASDIALFLTKKPYAAGRIDQPLGCPVQLPVNAGCAQDGLCILAELGGRSGLYKRLWIARMSNGERGINAIRPRGVGGERVFE